MHTPGGLVLAAMQIARAVEAHPGKVTVFVPVYAMSGGTLIALAADRWMTPRSESGGEGIGRRRGIRLHEGGRDDRRFTPRPVAIDDDLQELARRNAPCAELVQLRFFTGLTLDEAAAAMGIARRTAHRYWAFARAWLFDALRPG